MSRRLTPAARQGCAAAPARFGEAAIVRRSIAMALATTFMTVAMPASGQPRIPDGTIIETAAPGAATGSAAGPKETYRSRVRGEIAEWRQKMQAFDERVEARGRHAVSATEMSLRAAWDDTEVEARNVQAASSVGWDRTKRAYEAASHRMALAWNKARL